MSPLAPNVNGSQASFNQNGINQRNLIERGPDTKVTYSMGDLYGMRHSESRAPNLGNRGVLAFISRSTMHVPGAFSRNILSSAMDRAQRDCRQTNFNRSTAPAPPSQRHYRYANGDDSTGFRATNGERQRQPNHDRGQQMVHLSIKEDVKLNVAVNAWKPSFFQKCTASNDDHDITELSKQVRSILNKLTDKNFHIMLEQFKNLKIDTKEKLVAVIDLVFNKAVNEPNFSEGYAKLCCYLSQCSEQIDASSNERAYFKRTLINKCQFEFERHVANRNTTEAALAPLFDKLKLSETNGDASAIGEIKAEIADKESILRCRLVSTVRFIGELYKLDMLTTNIMNKCIAMLIREATSSGSPSTANQANEKLECLCKLLTTVGKKLEHKPNANATANGKSDYLNLTNYMGQLKAIANGKVRNFKPSTRIKFMLMDLIELRTNKWIPRITNAILHQKRNANF